MAVEDNIYLNSVVGVFNNRRIADYERRFDVRFVSTVLKITDTNRTSIQHLSNAELHLTKIQ